MSTRIPSKAEHYGLNPRGVDILSLIVYWLNNNPLLIEGERRTIASAYDVKLETMFADPKQPYRWYEGEHKFLFDRGILKRSYVCGKRIDWEPTQRGHQAIRDLGLLVFPDAPGFDYNTDRSPPLYGDANESVAHRKAVLRVGRLLSGMAWAYDLSSERSYGYTFYPTPDDEAVHDFHLRTKKGLTDMGAEAITGQHNLNHAVKKWKTFQEQETLTIWVADNRETLATLFNALHEQGHIELHGAKIANPESWALKPLNRKVWRSRYYYSGDTADEVLFTVSELFEEGRDRIEDRIKEYLSHIE